MQQAKFSIQEVQINFLNSFKSLGFKDKSSLVRTAIDHFKNNLELESLKKSAELYSEIYSGDDSLKELTETALTGWPE
ncbi:MAG: hypothetical protein K8S13_20760 [Desulfobacula sp.]|uniref:hypothetical protein n=1 Tax=Desulfobacula sp. TaxID=2593537 RepID=UPI0025C4717B|nr:hypothetical protein [Desulfobacula sp.]MCD4722266.1 hypothetical protein [Desulfobacula sp.]